MNKYIVGIAAILAALLTISVKTCSNRSKDRDRLSGNQTALMHRATAYRTKDSLSVISVQRLQLNVSELEDERGYLVATIKLLKLKPSRVQSVSTTAVTANYKVKTAIRDSIIYKAGKTDTLRCVDYSDKWLTFAGCASKGKFDGLIESRDTINQIVHRIPKQFWFIKYGTKAIRQEVLSKNPHSTIIFTEYIELTK